MSDSPRPFHALDVLFLFIIVTSAIAVGLLCLGVFRSQHAIFGGLFVTGGTLALWKVPITWRVPGMSPAILLIVLVALYFRVDPFLYLVGGQDQGVYVSMSRHYETHGTTVFQDRLRANMPRNFWGIYDRNNQLGLPSKQNQNQTEFPRARIGNHMPGIYVQDVARSEYVFQFYPLHPLWMAMFGSTFGSPQRIYALVFFSLLSIAALFLLTQEVTGSHFAAALVALLLALNPLHAFFSKFPVTEVVALCFNGAGFYYLARFVQAARRGQGQSRDLVWFVGLFGCMFFTRISGFMYIPFFFALLILILLLVDDARVRTHLALAFLAIGGVYALSVWYGATYSYPYFFDTHRGLFGRLLGNHWREKLAVLVAMMVAAIPLAWLGRRWVSARIRKWAEWLPRLVPFAILMAACLALYLAYEFSFTNAFVHDPWYSRWNVAGRGIRSLQHTSFISVLIYLSPFLLPALLVGLFVRRLNPTVVERDGVTPYLLGALGGFVLLFLVASTIFNRGVPYAYYYSRYFLSELLPYGLIIAAIGFTVLLRREGWVRYGSALLLVLTLVYFTWFTSHQLLGQVAEEANPTLERIATHVDDGDLLFVRTDTLSLRLHWQIRLPLETYFGKHVFAYNNQEKPLMRRFLREYASGAFDNIYVLSGEPVDAPGRVLVDTIALSWAELSRGDPIKIRFQDLPRQMLYVYRLDESNH